MKTNLFLADPQTEPDSHAEQRNGRAEETVWGRGRKKGNRGERGEGTMLFLELYLPPGVKPQARSRIHDTRVSTASLLYSRARRGFGGCFQRKGSYVWPQAQHQRYVPWGRWLSPEGHGGGQEDIHSLGDFLQPSSG